MSPANGKAGVRAATFEGDGMEPQVQGFGERFAWRMASVFASMVLLVVSGALMQGSAMVFYGVLLCLPLSHWFRWRAMRDERRRREAMQDERDADVLARAEHGFRLFVSCWFVLLALALSVPSLRDALPTHAYAMPALVVLGLLGGNIAQHLAVAALYRKDRLAPG